MCAMASRSVSVSVLVSLINYFVFVQFVCVLYAICIINPVEHLEFPGQVSSMHSKLTQSLHKRIDSSA